MSWAFSNSIIIICLLIDNMEESNSIKRLEIQTLKSSEIFKKLLVTGDDAYYFAEMETGLIIDINGNFIDLFGYTSDEAIGKTPLELRLYKNPGDRDLLISELKSMGFVKNMELQGRKKNGNIFTGALSINIVQLEKPYLVGVIRDITERKKTDEMLDSKNRILTSINKYTQAIAFTPHEKLFTTIATMLKEISGAAEVFINVYDREKAELVLRKSTLSEENNTWLRNKFGTKFADVKTPVPQDKYDEIMNSSLGRIGSIHEATFGAIPKSVGRIIEKMLGFCWFIGLALKHNERLVGTIIIAGKKDSPELEKDELLMYANVTASVLAQKHAEIELFQSENRFRSIFEQAAVGIAYLDLEGHWLQVNQKLCSIVGYTRGELMKLSFQDITYPEDLDTDLGLMRNMLDGQIENYTHEKRYIRKDGSLIWISLTKSLCRKPLSGPDYFITVFEDISKRKQNEEALQLASLYSRSLIETSLDPLVTISTEGKITDVNIATEKVTGISRKKLIGRDFVDFFAEPKLARAGYLKAFEQGKVIDYPLAIRHTSGVITDVLYNASVYRNEQGEILGVLAAARDITDRKKSEQEILRLSFHDYLTGLYNRRFFEEELKRLDTKRQLPLSFIMGDLNGLKLINDVFGHKEGDNLLVNTAEILKKVCRSDDILARWGGDEFVLILPKTSIQDSEEIVARIKKECKKTVKQKIPLSLSLGASTKETSVQSIQAIIIDAESNMYRNKLAQKERISSSVIFALEQALYEKSNETKEHIDRVRELAIKLGKSVKLYESQLNELSLLASLHDIGKVAIAETILSKEGKLTKKEWDVIKRHPEIGFNIASSSPQIAHIAKAILACHENFDGSGYPVGIAGESIPVISRIILISDAYDVMTRGRLYKDPMSKDDKIKEFKICAGSQFDPVLVEKFIVIISTT